MEKTEKSSKSGISFLKKLNQKAGIIVILLIMCIILSIVTNNFLTSRNLINILRQISFYCIIGLGSMMVIVTCGIDMSPGSIVGVISVVTALNGVTGKGNVFLWFVLAIVVGAIFGAANGILVAYPGLPAFIVTLGTQIIGRGIALLITDGHPITGLNENLVFLGAGKVGPIPMPVIIMAILCLITWYILRYTSFGRYIYAIGSNEQAAKISGINTKLVKMFVYVYAGILASIAGMVLTGRVASGQPALGEGYEVYSIAGAVIGGAALSGGVGTVYGVVVGSLVIGVLNNGMDLLGVSSYWQKIAQGSIIILAVLFDYLRKRNKQ